jgi:hypothetical protein
MEPMNYQSKSTKGIYVEARIDKLSFKCSYIKMQRVKDSQDNFEE